MRPACWSCVRPGTPARSLVSADHRFGDLAALLAPGDVLVVNDTRVLASALTGRRTRADGATARIALNLIKRLDDSRWQALARPAKRLVVGDRIRFGSEGRVCLLGELDATVLAKGEAGEIELGFSSPAPIWMTPSTRWGDAVAALHRPEAAA